MNDIDDRIVAVLAEIRDGQREHTQFYREHVQITIALQREQVARQKRAVRIQIAGMAVIVPYLVYVVIKFF